MRQFLASSMPSRDFYFLMTSLIVPRPIAFVSTVSVVNGVRSVNLAPFSFFTGVGSSPPSVVLSVTSASSPKLAKDTLVNVERDRQFVVNAASETYKEAVNNSSAELPYGESELSLTSLHVAPSSIVGPPRLAEACWALECQLLQTVDVGKRGSTGAATLVIGEIVCAHVREDVLQLGNKSGWLNLEVLKPLARLGGNSYCGVKDTFSLDRPKTPKKT